LLADAIVGPICVLLLPALKQVGTWTDARAAIRARNTAIALGVSLLLFVPAWRYGDVFGGGKPIIGTFYTLVFVASALFLLAGREVLGAKGDWIGRAAPWMALLLFAMFGRYWIDNIASAPLQAIATALLYATPVAAGLLMLAMARRDWHPGVGIADEASSPAATAP
jgi:PAT family beta-lactamase induction signal transducer AmpG